MGIVNFLPMLPGATQVIEQKALSLPDEARQFRISDQTTYERACSKLRDIITVRNEIEAHHEPIRKAIFESYTLAREANQASKDKLLKPVAEAEGIIKRAILVYEDEQKKIQDELIRKAREEAEERSRAERREQLAEAERKTREQINTMLDEASTFEEAEAILGQTETVVTAAVEEAKQEPLPPVRYEVDPVIYRAPGVSTATTYEVEIVNMKELCRAVADGEQSVELVMPNMPVLNKLAKALKKTFNVPGCRAVEKRDVRGRGRK